MMVDTTGQSAAGDATPASITGSVGTEATVPVWDLLVRIFHWSLVAAFVVAWATGEELRWLHELAGYTIVALLGIRIVWGLVGTAHARFADFLYRPSVVVRNLSDTLRLRARRYLGHSPAGGAMVIALMIMLALTSATGILLTGDASARGSWMRDFHEVAANLTIILVGLHLAGVFAASLEHRENLVRAMITGRKRP